MHMQSLCYEDFSYFGDVMYEIYKKNILERVLLFFKTLRSYTSQFLILQSLPS